MKNDLYRSAYTLDVDIGDMTVSLFHITTKDNLITDYSNSHFHTAYELQYVNSGKLSILDENKTHTVLQGDFLIVPPGTFHSNNADKDFVRSTLRFSLTANGKESDGFSEYCHYSRILEHVKGITVLKCEHAQNLFNRISTLDTKNQSDIHMIKLYAGLLITNILKELAIWQADSSDKTTAQKNDTLSAEDERIKFIIENCVQKFFAEDNVSKKIAAQLNMSDRNCSRIVNRLMGENITDIVIRQRMKLARILIIKTDKPLNEIALEVGYKTYVAFFTAFKKYYGISPMELKNPTATTK